MKIKEFSKKYLIGFFIGLILFTVVGVSAATYFPSNQTTYNNGITGMKATNVQTAIDELYNTCFPPTTADQVKGGLEKDPYECRYFFKGANPNNYITFNNETWRIISAECDGTIKIIKETSASNQVWDATNSNTEDDLTVSSDAVFYDIEFNSDGQVTKIIVSDGSKYSYTSTSSPVKIGDIKTIDSELATITCPTE